MGRILFLFCFLALMLPTLGKESFTQELVSTNDWIVLETGSAVNVRRALRESTGRPYFELPDLSNLSRRFHLLHQKINWGEPLLVEYRVEAEDWVETVGGNYRGSGRDENFAFLLRAEDGNWLPDRYGKVHHFGGLSVDKSVTAGQSFSYWHPVSRWSYPQEPGHYELHCVMWSNRHKLLGRAEALSEGLPPGYRFDEKRGLLGPEADSATQLELEINFQAEPFKSTPIKLPEQLKKELERRGNDTGGVCLYRAFSIEILKPRPEEAVKRWTKLGRVPGQTWPDDFETACYQSLWFNPSDFYFGFLKQLMKSKSDKYLLGLCLNPNSEAIELLLREPVKDVLPELGRLPILHRPQLRPWLLRLVDEGGESGERAKQLLESWH